MVCTAAGCIRQGAGLSCLKAWGKVKNVINKQVFDFPMLDAVSVSSKGFRLKYWGFLKNNVNLKELVVNLCSAR